MFQAITMAGQVLIQRSLTVAEALTLLRSFMESLGLQADGTYAVDVEVDVSVVLFFLPFSKSLLSFGSSGSTSLL
jgi:hypothetical protein